MIPVAALWLQAGPSLGLWGAIGLLREAIRQNLVPLSIAAIGLGLVGASLFVWRRRQAGRLPALLLVALALALDGEMWLLLGVQSLGGVAFLGAGVALTVAMVADGHRLGLALEPAPWSLRRELATLLPILVIVVAARLVLIGDVPYGWEGDEVNWVNHVVSARATEGARPYPLNNLVTSYLMQAPAHQLLGTSVNSARVGIAVFSIVATVLFYFAVREIVNVPVALLATYLMGVSIVDISASRVFHVEAHVKIWGILAALCLLLAYRRGPRALALLFLLAGLSLALGLMVYDSFIFTPIPFVAFALIQLFRERTAAREHRLVAYGLLLLPMLLVAPVVWTHLAGRRREQLSVLTGTTGVFLDGVGKIPELLPVLPGYLLAEAGIMVRRMTVQAFPDVMTGRPGPMESAAWVPFLFLGLILAFRFFQRRHILFALLWLLVPALPTALLIGQAVPRTFFPYWGAFQVMAAIAFWVCFRGISDQMSGRGRCAATVVFGVYLSLLGTSNLYVYFNEVVDPPDRQRRRELGDLVASNIAPGELVFLPYLPLHGDIMGFERYAPKIQTHDRAPAGVEGLYYRFVPYPDLLKGISAAKAPLTGLKVIYDKSIDQPGLRRDVLDGFIRCFPQLHRTAGRAFDVYAVSAAGLATSQCYSDVAVVPGTPREGALVEDTAPVRFLWGTTMGAQTEYQLELQRFHDGVVWLEAETFSLGSGWAPGAALAPGFSGDAYMLDVEVSDRIFTRLEADVATSGVYDIWVRTFRRRDDRSPAYLSVSGIAQEVARPIPSGLGQWRWERLEPTALAAGAHEVRLSRSFDRRSDPWPIFVDAVVLSSDLSFDPNESTDWEPVLSTGTVQSPEGAFTTPEPLPPGRYRWRVKVTDGERLMAPDGSFGIFSPYRAFAVAGG